MVWSCAFQLHGTRTVWILDDVKNSYLLFWHFSFRPLRNRLFMHLLLRRPYCFFGSESWKPCCCPSTLSIFTNYSASTPVKSMILISTVQNCPWTITGGRCVIISRIASRADLVTFFPRILGFQKKTDALCICIVFDARGTSFYRNGYRFPRRSIQPVEGLDSYPSILSVPGVRSTYFAPIHVTEIDTYAFWFNRSLFNTGQVL